MKSNLSKVLIMLFTFVIALEGISMAYTSNYQEPVNVLIRKGTYGVGVKWVQDMLNHNGYNLVVDGIFGANTYNAVVNFQTKHSLGIDGIVGAQTRNALKKFSDESALPAFLRNSLSLVQIIKNCKSYYAKNNFVYSTASGARTIPADKSKLYNGNYCVDCSSYVSWALYEYALINGNIPMQKYFNYQRSSSTFASIGANGGNDYLTVVDSKTPSKLVDLSKAKPGDILVTPSHVEFFYSYSKTGNNTASILVYNCGSNSSIKVDGTSYSGTKNISDITYILRVK